MSLRSGVSYWQVVDPTEIRAPRLAGDTQCEVAVLGGGITGALVSRRLIQAGIDTILVDKRKPATGSTLACTGLLQYSIDTPLVELIGRMGEARAVHAYTRGVRAIDELESMLGELGDDCGFARRDTLYFASHWWHAHRLKQEFECRRAHGFDVEFLDRHALAERSSIRSRGAMCSRHDGEIDPYRLTKSVIENAMQQGLRVFADTEIRSVRETPREVSLESETGAIRARAIVYATGYESRQFLPADQGSLHSTYAVASEPVAAFHGWPDRMLVWETARPYFYARQIGDGRALIGGGDTAFASDHERDGLVERKVAALVDRFQQLFPEAAFEPAFAWAGTFGESSDGLPYIGKLGERPAYCALGYGGNGITFSIIAAGLICDLYCGRPNDDAEVFGLRH